MSNRRSASRARWVTCFTSLFLVGLLACIALGEISLGFNGQAELEYLRNTKTRLTPYTDESIKVLRGHLDRMEAKGVPTPPPPPDAVALLPAELPIISTGWDCSGFSWSISSTSLKPTSVSNRWIFNPKAV